MKYLFVVDRYYPKPYINSVCAQNVIDELTTKGNEVVVLCFLDEDNEKYESFRGNKIYYVKPDARLKYFYKSDNLAGTKKGKIYWNIAKFLSLSKKIFTFAYDPFYSFSFPRRIKKKILSIIYNESIDCVVTMFQPFDGTYAMYQLKKENKVGNIPWIVYTVDNTENQKIKKLLKIRSSHNYWSVKFLKYCTGFVYMESRTSDYSKSIFDDYRNKLFVADLPTYIKNNGAIKGQKDSTPDFENWTYLGSINKIHYDPTFMVNFFKSLNDSKKRELHFYTRGDCVDYLNKEAALSNNTIFVHNYVSQDELNELRNNATYLVSIKVSSFISAKIFDYISSGKPIIHFSSSPDDPDIPYLLKYPRAVIVKEYDNKKAEELVDKYYQDLSAVLSSSINQNQIDALFEKNTPEYSARLIESIANGIK